MKENSLINHVYKLVAILLLMCLAIASTGYFSMNLVLLGLAFCIGMALILFKWALLYKVMIEKLEQEKKAVLQENKLIQEELTSIKSKEDKESEISSLLDKPIKLFDGMVYKYKDVLYFESRNDAVFYFTKDEQYHPPTYKSLKKLKDTLLMPPVFIPIHRKHIVNIFNVQSIDRKKLTLKLVNGNELKIARLRKVEVLNAFERCQEILLGIKNYMK